ncbi:SemiSWEET family sugar transporter [Chloroflexota bacterium]
MDILGYLGGGIFMISFFPQVIRVVKLKTTNEISLVFTLLMFVGCLIWTAYAFYVRQLPMMVTSVMNTFQTGLLLFFKCIYSQHPAQIIIDTKLIKESDTVVSLEETQLMVEDNRSQIETTLN